MFVDQLVHDFSLPGSESDSVISGSVEVADIQEHWVCDDIARNIEEVTSTKREQERETMKIAGFLSSRITTSLIFIRFK